VASSSPWCTREMSAMALRCKCDPGKSTDSQSRVDCLLASDVVSMLQGNARAPDGSNAEVQPVKTSVAPAKLKGSSAQHNTAHPSPWPREMPYHARSTRWCSSCQPRWQTRHRAVGRAAHATQPKQVLLCPRPEGRDCLPHELFVPLEPLKAQTPGWLPKPTRLWPKPTSCREAYSLQAVSRGASCRLLANCRRPHRGRLPPSRHL